MSPVREHMACLFSSEPIQACGREVVLPPGLALWPLVLIGVVIVWVAVLIVSHAHNPLVREERRELKALRLRRDERWRKS
jgi:hypothetical protein